MLCCANCVTPPTLCTLCSEHRFWRRSGLKKKKKKGDGTLSDSGSSTPVLSSPRSSVHLEELDLCLPSQCTPVPPGTDRKKATIESVVQELLQSEAVYVEELAAITKVRLSALHTQRVAMFLCVS